MGNIRSTIPEDLICPNNTNVSTRSELQMTVLGTLISILVLIIVIGNVMVITAISRFQRLQNVTNCFITSLACADLVMGLVVVPFGALYIILNTWHFGNTLCDFWTATDVLCVTASIETLCVIAMDRYIAITSPFRYQSLLTKNRARFIVLMVWVIAGLVSYLPIHTGLWNSRNNKTFCCLLNETCCEFDISYPYAIVSSIISFYIPLVIMVFVYSRVFQEARKQLKKINKTEGRFHAQKTNRRNQDVANNHSEMRSTKKAKFYLKEHKALKTLGIIMGVFTLCWLPFFVLNVIPQEHVDILTFRILNWIGYANSAFNPLIYCRSPDFRYAFKEILCLNRSRYPNVRPNNGYIYNAHSWQSENREQSKGSSGDSDHAEENLAKEGCLSADKTDSNGNCSKAQMRAL
ncbi:adrenoceptor beta 2, surface a [Danio aesculapii]|uniref:adrenoceptor beta 2, surface a n=1 Tax=Danio aesculapii TaxID=1142201 RepID=UPI0024C0D556|nr:adrenoceptor beta 2, surface a [Danio aesculapii]